MNHRKVILLWIVMMVGMALSCRRLGKDFGDPPEIEWMKVYELGGFGKADEIVVCSDNGYFAVGFFRSDDTNGDDIWYLKTVSNGDILWKRSIHEKGDQYAHSVCLTSDGGFIIAGYSAPRDLKKSKILMIKIDKDGEILWKKMYGQKGYDCRGYSVTETSDGCFIVAGDITPSYIFKNPFNDAFLLKIDSIGDSLWARSYGGNDQDLFNSILKAKNGDLVIAGGTASFRNVRRPSIYLMGTKADGDTLWSKVYGDSNSYYIGSARQTLDGGYIVLGTYFSPLGDIFLAKFNKNEALKWKKYYGGKGNDDYGEYLVQSNQGGYVLLGSNSSDAKGFFDIWVIGVDSLGDTLWTIKYGDVLCEYGKCIQRTLDGGFIILGEKCSSETRRAQSILLIKLKPEE